MRWSFTQKKRVEPATGGKAGKNLRIASPCSAKWEEMKGTDWMRHCTECNLNVYNFSEMTWKEVERLVASRQGRLCARFYRRADGTMLTQDCPKGLRAVVRRVSRWAGAALSAVTVFSSGQAQARSWAEHIEQAQTENGTATGSAAYGEASVAVQVKDIAGAVMPHTRVVLQGRRGEPVSDAMTDENGRARFQSLSAGTYRLVAIMSGFEDDPQAFVLGKSDVIEVSFTMRPAHLMGDVVMVDAPPIPAKRSEPRIDLPAAAKGNESLQPSAGVGRESNAGGKLSSSVIGYASLVLKVKDRRGEMIAGAAIILRDSRSGRQWTGVSDSQGNFAVPSLLRGRYLLTVRAAGFGLNSSQVEVLRSGAIELEVLLRETDSGGLLNIEELPSASREKGVEAAFR